MSWVAVGISVVTAVAGAAVSISGQQQQKKAVQAQADYNEKVARQEADRENQLAAQNAMRVQKEKTRTIGAIVAANAANGLAMEGTPLAVLGEVAGDFEQEIADIGYGAANRRLSLLSGAELGQWSARQQKSAITLNQVSTGINAVGSAGRGYLTATGN